MSTTPHTVSPEAVVTKPSPLAQAVDANNKQVVFEKFINSTIIKIILTVFFMVALFSAAFIVAYQMVVNEEAKKAINEIPQANVTVPNISEVPTSTPIPEATSVYGIETQLCGGVSGVQCPEGYQCVLDGEYADSEGTCYENTFVDFGATKVP